MLFTQSTSKDRSLTSPSHSPLIHATMSCISAQPAVSLHDHTVLLIEDDDACSQSSSDSLLDELIGDLQQEYGLCDSSSKLYSSSKNLILHNSMGDLDAVTRENPTSSPSRRSSIGSAKSTRSNGRSSGGNTVLPTMSVTVFYEHASFSPGCKEEQDSTYVPVSPPRRRRALNKRALSAVKAQMPALDDRSWARTKPRKIASVVQRITSCTQ